MVTDKQVRRMMKMVEMGKTKDLSSLKAGMDRKTARKYLELGRLPSDVEKKHTWRTRRDPFEEVWDEVLEKLEPFPRLEAKTLFEFLQREYPGRFADGELRTLQRRVKAWQALEGPGREVFFPQEHHPGILCESDFTRMGGLEVTIQSRHLIICCMILLRILFHKNFIFYQIFVDFLFSAEISCSKRASITHQRTGIA